ncbi:type B 50S ribosomal protein L31 [Actinomadura macrotermitis]|uniref:Large ribosomal subunit protein bL31B n=1 Tax=Actinomadura macrotermitis TaxID=2585200 RepID=A0A7K0C1N0_9ACTN|nr:type B 50S ribosomal protein L31 [Actinomadura macrotermitis]MQY07368.1 50S ribosomal protein L31 type B [Actinomadura macrotermitis]
MKKNIHPQYRPVVFRDRGADYAFLTRSTAVTDRTVEWTDGNTYPVVDVDVSAASHPFYTGKSRLMDTTGAVEKFNRRYGR